MELFVIYTRTNQDVYLWPYCGLVKPQQISSMVPRPVPEGSSLTCSSSCPDLLQTSHFTGEHALGFAALWVLESDIVSMEELLLHSSLGWSPELSIMKWLFSDSFCFQRRSETKKTRLMGVAFHLDCSYFLFYKLTFCAGAWFISSCCQ